MRIKIAVLATAVLLAACGADESAGSYAGAVDTTASTGKSGTYLARGSFTGGLLSDGMDVHSIEWSEQDGFERIEIRIHEAIWGEGEKADPVPVPCRFKVHREDYPARLLVVVGGTRMFSAQAPELPEDALVKDYYRIVYLDDAGFMFSFDVESDTEFEVFESHDPAMIVIDIRTVPAGSRGGPESVFSLRSVSWPPGEGAGHFEEKLMKAGAKSPRTIRDSKGWFCVEEGWYPDKKAAEEKLIFFGEKGISLYIEQRSTGDKPGHIRSLH